MMAPRVDAETFPFSKHPPLGAKIMEGAGSATRDRGFAISATALAILLIMILTSAVISNLAGIEAEVSESRESKVEVPHVIKRLLKNAAAYASETGDPGDAEGYISSFLTQANMQKITENLPKPNGSGAAFQRGVGPGIYRRSDGSAGSVGGAILVDGLPAGSYVAVADAHGLVALAGPCQDGMRLVIQIPRAVPCGYLAAYTPSSTCWRWSGTISNSQIYSVSSSPPSVSTIAWSPPDAFPYVRVRGAPQLALAMLLDQGGVIRGASIKPLVLPEAIVSAQGVPFAGSLTVMAPEVWIEGEIGSGDAFVYIGG